jgi:DNA polymerase-3 subunit gamma/tau
LFCGPRGVGKTTCARIFAKEINLFQNTDQIDDFSYNIFELDAASNNSVDDIRNLTDQVRVPPQIGKYKVYIIDEVHMLSQAAFNAPLKTLEEPPPHLKFIFATTEVKKIPITIISRCQRFDLHRIATTVLTSHLMNLAKKENINIDKDAMALIVRSADGSVRDGLSLLDQAITNEKDKITANSIIDMLGLADRGNIFDLMDAIFQGDPANALAIFNRIHQAGADVVMIFDEMLNVTHFITQIKIAPELKEDIHIPELERNKGFEMAEKISMASLGMIWQVLFKGYEELQSGFHLFQQGEMIIILRIP